MELVDQIHQVEEADFAAAGAIDAAGDAQMRLAYARADDKDDVRPDLYAPWHSALILSRAHRRRQESRSSPNPSSRETWRSQPVTDAAHVAFTLLRPELRKQDLLWCRSESFDLAQAVRHGRCEPVQPQFLEHGQHVVSAACVLRTTKCGSVNERSHYRNVTDSRPGDRRAAG